MSDKFIFMEAINCIDDNYLDKYFAMKTKQSYEKAKKRKVLKWTLSMAACLSVLLISLFLTNLISSNETQNIQYSYSDKYQLYYKGNKSISKYGVIEYVDFDDESITLQFDKTTSDYVYISLCGYDTNLFSDTEKINYGTTLHNAQVATDVTVINDGIRLFVDDQLVSDFPQKIGKYTIRIEYCNLKKICDQLDVGIYISGFGYFTINPFSIEETDPNIPPSDANTTR